MSLTSPIFSHSQLHTPQPKTESLRLLLLHMLWLGNCKYCIFHSHSLFSDSNFTFCSAFSTLFLSVSEYKVQRGNIKHNEDFVDFWLLGLFIIGVFDFWFLFGWRFGNDFWFGSQLLKAGRVAGGGKVGLRKKKFNNFFFNFLIKTILSFF